MVNVKEKEFTEPVMTYLKPEQRKKLKERADTEQLPLSIYIRKRLFPNK